ncbi:hypothetical protein Vqi01_20100 [Micromonospora qiuiae]|uniref:Uncharacterized protein n=1 Tax=Micromonospora qiuiae TaxID=502268 RepID=A0ABQ4J9J7_9ACTN|nr:hypothetical protein Vqi01_20100 [Micromonospora qiuiae]
MRSTSGENNELMTPSSPQGRDTDDARDLNIADRRFAVMAVSRALGHRRTDETESINWLRRPAAEMPLRHAP